MRPAPAAIEAVAGVVESALRRVGGLIDAVGAAIAAVLELAGSAALLVPVPVWVAAVCLGIWRGRHLGRAVVAGVSLQVVAFSGAWADAVTTVAAGVVLGVFGVALAAGVSLLTRRSAARSGAPIRGTYPVTTALTLVAVLALLPLTGTTGRSASALGGVLLAFALAYHLGGPWPGGSAWPQLGRLAVSTGLGAVLFVQVAASGDGLGGAAVRAATTGDVALALQALLAAGGVAVALGAAFGRPATGDPEETEASDRPSLAPDLDGATL